MKKKSFMAKKKIMTDSPQSPKDVCGLCGNAFGFCFKGHDGKPICCRCRHSTTGYLLMCEQTACNEFTRGREELPTEGISFATSPDPDADKRQEKCIPVFREGGEVVIIPVSKIGPKGINADGTPIE